jgi:hypothetical protein
VEVANMKTGIFKKQDYVDFMINNGRKDELLIKELNGETRWMDDLEGSKVYLYMHDYKGEKEIIYFLVEKSKSEHDMMSFIAEDNFINWIGEEQLYD